MRRALRRLDSALDTAVAYGAILVGLVVRVRHPSPRTDTAREGR